MGFNHHQWTSTVNSVAYDPHLFRPTRGSPTMRRFFIKQLEFTLDLAGMAMQKERETLNMVLLILWNLQQCILNMDWWRLAGLRGFEAGSNSNHSATRCSIKGRSYHWINHELVDLKPVYGKLGIQCRNPVWWTKTRLIEHLNKGFGEFVCLKHNGDMLSQYFRQSHLTLVKPLSKMILFHIMCLQFFSG